MRSLTVQPSAAPQATLPPRQDWRRTYIEQHGGEHKRHALFFCELDELSTPPVVQAGAAESEQAKSMQQVVDALRERLFARARNDPALGGFGPKSVQLAAACPVIETWSGLQLDLLHRHYAPEGGNLDIAAVEEAFELFVSGRLRVRNAGRRGIGEPDSAYYFAFAEFALMCLDLGIETTLWEKQLPHLVWTQDVYVHMQSPIGMPPARFRDFGPRGKERVFDPQIAARARTRVRTLPGRANLELIHTSNCRKAFIPD